MSHFSDSVFGEQKKLTPLLTPLFMATLISGLEVIMETSRQTNIGVKARLHEQTAIELALRGWFIKPCIRVIERLCNRCIASGKCINDVYDNFTCKSNTIDVLGCPEWCHILAHLKEQVR